MSKISVLFYLSIITTLLVQGCSGCSKSGHREAHGKVTETSGHNIIENDDNQDNEKIFNVVKMKKNNGVYEIPTEINGIPMYFIFDTGAGLISISATEANFLYKQGTLSNSDIVGPANFIDANGDISEGRIIILKTVKIGNKTLRNVEASVVNNLNAPLLMGQSALENFGKISIDYGRSQISFE